MTPKHIRTVQQIGTQRVELAVHDPSGIQGHVIEEIRQNVAGHRLYVGPGSYMMIEVDNEPPEVGTRPGEDAGAALVGVECYVWNGPWFYSRVLTRILEYSSERGYRVAAYIWWRHARPAEIRRLCIMALDGFHLLMLTSGAENGRRLF